MPAVKDILPKLEVRTSNRANKCKRNTEHGIPKGDVWLIITPRGPVARDYGYCLQCGTAILSELDPSTGAAVPLARRSSPPSTLRPHDYEVVLLLFNRLPSGGVPDKTAAPASGCHAGGRAWSHS